MKKSLLITALACTVGIFMTAGPAAADCAGVVGVDCDEYTGAGKKGSHFRINVPTTPAWDGDLVIINHGFDLDPLNIAPHGGCQLAHGTSCTTDGDCAVGNCNEIGYLGIEDVLLPAGKAIAASTYSLTGWSTFQSRKDLQDILKFIKKNPNIPEPTRVIITGFSMGGAVTIDATLRLNPKKIDAVLPICPASGGGVPTWDAAHDLRLAYDYVCAGVPGGQFFSVPDQGDPIETLQLAVRVDNCLGALGGGDANQLARMAEFRTIVGHVGTDFEAIVIMGFATQGMFDLVQPKSKLKGKAAGWNDTGVVYPDAGFEAGAARTAAGKGRKKLGKNYTVDYTKGKGKKVDYPIMTIAGNADFLTIPGFQTVWHNGLTIAGKDFMNAWIDTGDHCAYTEDEFQATFDEFFAWIDGGLKPTDQDLQDACLALPGTPDCNFDVGFVGPPLTTRVPARPDWPVAAQ